MGYLTPKAFFAGEMAGVIVVPFDNYVTAHDKYGLINGYECDVRFNIASEA